MVNHRTRQGVRRLHPGVAGAGAGQVGKVIQASGARACENLAGQAIWTDEQRAIWEQARLQFMLLEGGPGEEEPSSKFRKVPMAGYPGMSPQEAWQYQQLANQVPTPKPPPLRAPTNPQAAAAEWRDRLDHDPNYFGNAEPQEGAPPPPPPQPAPEPVSTKPNVPNDGKAEGPRESKGK